MRDDEKHGAPVGTSRERKKFDIYLVYVSLMRNISDSEPSSYEEDVKQQVWKYFMIEEYHSIMKNDVCDIVPRLERKLVVTYRWI